MGRALVKSEAAARIGTPRPTPGPVAVAPKPKAGGTPDIEAANVRASIQYAEKIFESDLNEYLRTVETRPAAQSTGVVAGVKL